MSPGNRPLPASVGALTSRAPSSLREEVTDLWWWTRAKALGKLDAMLRLILAGLLLTSGCASTGRTSAGANGAAGSEGDTHYETEKDELGSADILGTVLANKAGLAECAQEQRNRERGITGKLVMKWTIQTNGKASNVSVVSKELEDTYMAGCVERLIESMSFPPHKKQGEPVQFPFKF